MSKRISCLKKKKKGEDLIPRSLKLRKKKKHTVFFIQGGDIFLAGGHRLSQKEKLKCCSTRFKFDPEHSL